MIKFKIGNKYFMKYKGDHNLLDVFEVVGRTEKTVKLKDEDGYIKRYRIKNYEGSELISPNRNMLVNSENIFHSNTKTNQEKKKYYSKRVDDPRLTTGQRNYAKRKVNEFSNTKTIFNKRYLN